MEIGLSLADSVLIDKDKYVGGHWTEPSVRGRVGAADEPEHVPRLTDTVALVSLDLQEDGYLAVNASTLALAEQSETTATATATFVT